ETFPSKLIGLIQANNIPNYTLSNLYGPAETTITSTFHLVDIRASTKYIPIGRPLSNYRCLILNGFLQNTSTHEVGELFVGGVGVFAGYHGRDDLTATALVEIGGQLFYRTGDLVRLDNSGLLHYQGRKDHQIKLHGQRVELGEIEQCLLLTSITACVVIKWNDDHLVAYVQSSHIDEQELREHCQSYLPLHMIPSLFIILDKLPLNSNGKIDRKLLPSPTFSSMHLTNHDELLLPMNENEIVIHHIWCDLLKQKQISTNTNIFSIGGHSIVIMQLFHQYKIQFHLNANSLSISDLFQHPTIIDHARLIYQTMNMTENINDYDWSSLHIIEASASFAQERIFLDEQIRFSSTDNNTNNMYVIPLMYRVSSMNNHISISQLQNAFQSIISKHEILRTALYLDINGSIAQHCLDTNIIIHEKQSSRFSIINLPDEVHEQNEIVKKILAQSDLFDLSKGHVINCHILRHHQSNDSCTQNNGDLLTKDDLILFTIHHACFDGTSTSILIRDLSLAYQSSDLFPIDDNSLQYIDYSIHEHIMDMTLSQEFWLLELKGYNLTRQLSLPVDRQRSSTNQQRSGLASSAQITFDDEICRSFLNYASSHHLTLFQLGLSIFYVFLFKLTHGETDLCVSSINANRYRSELVNMIGMFVSTLPYRVELDSHWLFDEVVRYVQEKCLSILEHSNYPLQHILADLHVTQSNVSFLESMFDFITISNEGNDLSLNGVNLEQVSLNDSYVMAKFDFSLRFVYNPSSDNNQLSCYFVCSRDLFDETTLAIIDRRFQHVLEQLFSSKSSTKCIDLYCTSISKFDLILSEEVEERQAIIFHRLENIINETPASFAQCRIWSENQGDIDTDQLSLTIHNMSFFYRLCTGDVLSVKQLRHALQLIVTKHESLHTSLIYDSKDNQLMQRVLTQQDINNDMFTITESTYETDEQLNAIMGNEKCDPQLFDLAQGPVFRCHIIYYKQISSNNILSDKDIIIFSFHRAFFDYLSMNIFLHDLDQAYKTDQLTADDVTTLRYIDYAVIERQTSMTGASMYWLDTLYAYHLGQSLSLPYDRYRLTNEHRTNRATSISFDFGQDVSQHFLTYASSNNIKHQHLALAIYFIFLLKLTNGEQDLCIGMNIDNRYRDELKSIIGMFENIIPLRCQLDPHWSFQYLLDYVREITTNSMKYSYFPLQRILNQHPNVSKPAFLDISFEFLSSMTRRDNQLIMIDDSQLSSIPSTMNINDFSLIIQHDLNVGQLSCTINASLDLFNVETIDKISQRFHSILNQLFTFVDNQMNKSIYEISLTLPNERLLMQSMNNTQVSFPSALTCVHHEFVYQVMKHPQKLAVELDEQSLTYAELLHYVQVLSLHLINKYAVVPGEIICQCVERSLSMVIGIMAIEMVGGVYCPLSPRDPQHRLHALIQQTQSRLVLVHWLTKMKFNNDIVLIDTHSVLFHNDVQNDVNRLSSITVTSNNIAYIIFTSGSTGVPKAVKVRHMNFAGCIYSLVGSNTLNKHDTVVQMARCSFDLQLQEILGSLMIGVTVVLLHPKGTVDFDYLCHILHTKEVTYMQSVPSLLQSFFIFLEQCDKANAIKYLRSICCAGEPFSVKFRTFIAKIDIPHCTVWNLYGSTETTLVSTHHLVDIKSTSASIPVGRSLPNYQSLLLNKFLQSTCISQIGELFIGGVGVFAGYLGRDDLTAKALIEIDGNLFYRISDIVQMDENGLLHYHGRKDHQIKLHGQRIELCEIEQCLLTIPSISACVVIKWSDDHLVVYVQSSYIDENLLREHCQAHLPPHMIPSLFIILVKFPLNANGKIDRKLLLPPSFSLMHCTNDGELLVPINEYEIIIHHIWCNILKQKQISTNTNIFTLGGHSLVIMQLFHRYKTEFNLEIKTLSITKLFEHPTIIDHAQLIYQTISAKENINDYHWSSLHIIEAKASFAQERIFLDEQIRFSSTDNNTNNMYVIPLIYRISSMNDHISISQLQHTFQSIIRKHQILRTALYLDTNGTIIQHCLDTNAIIYDEKASRFSIINLRDEEHEQNETVKKILNQSDLFGLSKGHVINCHILRQDQSNDSCTQNNGDLLTKDDLILFTIHHAMFDGASRSIFIRELSLAYQSIDLLPIDDNSFQYIDYSIHEHIMDMTLSREFWQLELKGYNLTRQLSLPVDRQRSTTNQQRSGLASSAQITFDDEICRSFLNYASSHHLTLFQLGLSIFYVFLFKLTHGETDLCVSSINANRYRSELVNMIGMFVSTLPYRVELDRHWSFDEVVRYVQEKCLSILEHSHYPLQHILSDLHLTQSNVSFLETMFDFITISEDASGLCLNGVNLEQVLLDDSYEMAKFDFSLRFLYNSSSDDNQLSCSFICSRDLFGGTTVAMIGRRFKYLCEQIFAPASFAQSRIWSENQRHTNTDQSSLTIHNMSFFYRLYTGDILSVKQLRHALQLIVTKHESLHTLLIYDSNKNILMQRILTQQDINNDMVTITESSYETDEQLNAIIENEKCNPQLFDLTQALVFRCHIIYYKQISSNNILSDRDIIIFNFHPALFDYPSINLFLYDLDQAYKTGQLTSHNATTLRYIDYAIVEQEMSMTGASMFWHDILHDCKLDQYLLLPYDRYRLSNEHRTGRGTSISFDFGPNLSQYFLTCASANSISLE
ncbi:unnamed protein product, partial [Adineta steineri]